MAIASSMPSLDRTSSRPAPRSVLGPDCRAAHAARRRSGACGAPAAPAACRRPRPGRGRRACRAARRWRRRRARRRRSGRPCRSRWPNAVSRSTSVAGQVGDDAADAARGGEQRRGLAVDRREVGVLGAVDVEGVLQLERPRPRTAGRSWRPAARPPRCRATRRSPTPGPAGSRRRGSPSGCPSGRSRSRRCAG